MNSEYILREAVFQANLKLRELRLVLFTWGNVSVVDRANNRMFIKPSGVPYEELNPENMVEVGLDGRLTAKKFKPSSDTDTHLELYNSFPAVEAVVHTHSRYATMWAQACLALPCFGTTHADHFHGEVPVTRKLKEAETSSDYEANTGKVIVETFKDNGINPESVPAVLVAQHGPFTWGKTAEKAVMNAAVLEAVAEMALGSFQLNPAISALSTHLLDCHFCRKHGPGAYYGQA